MEDSFVTPAGLTPSPDDPVDFSILGGSKGPDFVVFNVGTANIGPEGESASS